LAGEARISLFEIFSRAPLPPPFFDNVRIPKELDGISAQRLDTKEVNADFDSDAEAKQKRAKLNFVPGRNGPDALF
jgi:hypothetical protein